MMPLTLRTISVTSSFTPGIVENSCCTPLILVLVTAVPGNDESKILRKEFPNEMTVVAIVTPKALRRERLANRPVRPLTAAEVAERDRSEIENLEKGGPIAIADYYVDNSGTIEEFHEAFGKLMKDIGFID